MWADDAAAWVLENERGEADHPDDPGGATIHGITRRHYPEWYERVMKAHRRSRKRGLDEARAFYRELFGSLRRFDRIEQREAAMIAFDMHVQHGQAGRLVQKALNQLIHGLRFKALAEDNVMGPKTIARMNALTRQYPAAVVAALLGERYKYFLRLFSRNDRLGAFMRGWVAHRCLPPGVELT